MVAAQRGKACGNRGALKLPILGALIIALSWAILLGAGPATQPVQQIRAWVDQLADSDPDARTQAVERLMGLGAAELPNLHDAVAQAMPLLPSQRVALHEIVTQIFLAGAPYQPSEVAQPFLGVRGAPLDPDSAVDGMLVVKRVPGFAAYRMLRDGDIIRRIVELPEAKFVESTGFSKAISDCRVGQTITLVVVRNGKQTNVRVELRARPARSDVQDVDDWIEELHSQADSYWDSAFAPLVSDGESVS